MLMNAQADMSASARTRTKKSLSSGFPLVPLAAGVMLERTPKNWKVETFARRKKSRNASPSAKVSTRTKKNCSCCDYHAGIMYVCVRSKSEITIIDQLSHDMHMFLISKFDHIFCSRVLLVFFGHTPENNLSMTRRVNILISLDKN